MSRYIILGFALLLLLTSCGGGGSNVPSYSRRANRRPVVVRPVTPEITMQYSFYASGDSLYLILKFEDVQKVVDVQQTAFALEYDVKPGSAASATPVWSDSLGVTNWAARGADGGLFVNLALPKQVVQEPNMISMRIWQRFAGQERMGTKFNLLLTSAMLEKDYLVVMADSEQPLINNYVTVNDKLLVRHYGAQSDSVQESLTVHFFDTDFAPALPPMSMRQEPGPRTLAVSDILSFPSNDTITFDREGVYLIDPNASYSKSILVKKWSYPLVTMSDEMLQPLIYLTTSAEREALYNAKDTKEAIDNFWLKIADNESIARGIIRTFYSRVETANRQFTSHKAGWATDKGMIYIIYGRPNDISRVGPNEAWIYRESETSPYVKFVFTKKENNFTENHYELVRRREYEENWYSTVAKWRAGITDM
ncbi:GWxTD domain-containing protein [Pontibacter silvestris]|uniref:GWxTD domain-containing protein n=1 Tax=Pontibacter silvestris TaxID=2305183 RepID=A0ABW4WU25_9BACT|nr:GWxTD domain-containing protein [Pontibacter silvestris]MCC9137308.1 GWxTD domain-containing protein [Pontibacter silvestris]